jgi:hypothetical protein
VSKSKLIILMCFMSLIVSTTFADENDDALKKTQDCLRKGNCATINTKEGQAADQKALGAVGGDVSKKQELYNISADIMPVLLQQAGGDPVKMQEILLKAQTDPEGFLKSLPADIRAKISNTARSVAADKAPAQNP